MRRSLGYKTELTYETLTDKVQPWNFGRGGSGYLNVSERLQSAMVANPHLKVMVAEGYYDMATPFLSVDYTLNHLDLSRDLRANIEQRYYEGGHMMYHYRPGLAQLKGDVAKFMEGAGIGR